MGSVWSENSSIRGFEKLYGDKKTDVLIIGGGMAGILCAYFLKEKGIDYILAEGQRIGGGVTQNTTAKITAQHGLIYDNMIKNAGIEKAKLYLAANLLAVKKYKELAKDIECDFEEKPAFTYSTDNREKIEKEVDAANKLGMKASFEQSIPIPVNHCGAIRFNGQAQFNQLKFIDSISRDLNICEKTFISDIDVNTAYYENGKITAKKIIIATHFPFINSHGSYFLKLYQHRSYVITLENAPDVAGMYVDEKETGMSFRNYNGLLLIGGGDHRTGKTGGGWEELRHFARRVYEGSSEKYAWATQDCMTLDGAPYIGRYSKQTPDMLVATGFNKWGMTSSMVSAMILSDMAAGRKNDFAAVFSPDRSMMKMQLLLNGFEAVKNLLCFSKKRCTHMGCSLKWNGLEHTWDCACHGSRFDEKGKVLDNPATKKARLD